MWVGEVPSGFVIFGMLGDETEGLLVGAIGWPAIGIEYGGIKLIVDLLELGRPRRR